MRNVILIFVIFPLQIFAQHFKKEEIQRWKIEAKNVNIVRDNWGIPHIYGKTDADAVFGLLYAQCEDDFPRIEMNYIEKLGRMAEVKGEAALYSDLLIRMIIDPADAIADYKKSPPWLHKLLDAFADGINFYLYKNPGTKPALLQRFKPWYPLLWTDGSIGAISTGGVSEDELKNFYTGSNIVIKKNKTAKEETLSGSNGFAFSPSITASHHSILYINPHVTFYFRPEVHVVSEEGLDAYGAVTWGQFFIYQGFNKHCGWMHTSSDVDVADMYAEKISKKNNSFFYEYNKTERPVTKKTITLRYTDGANVLSKTITTFFTHHGPVMAKRDGKWISVKSNNRSMTGLIQSWQRTKAKSFEEYKKVMGLLANTSNNTVYADAEGNIAYWHGNFIPKRDTMFDWSKPVDGSISATEWRGLHTVNESVHIYNPPNGWIQNCNSTPFTAAGQYSPKKENYPSYMAPDGENFRGLNAVRVLSKENMFTIDKVIAAGYDTYLAAFEKLVPALVNSFIKNITTNDSLYTQLAEPINVLKNWNLRCGEN
ncbi:MAG: penicillin acylase family protein, partial [Ginsengibacter sp.]